MHFRAFKSIEWYLCIRDTFEVFLVGNSFEIEMMTDCIADVLRLELLDTFGSFVSKTRVLSNTG